MAFMEKLKYPFRGMGRIVDKTGAREATLGPGGRLFPNCNAMEPFGIFRIFLIATLLPSFLYGQDTAWFHLYGNTNARCSSLQRSSSGDLFMAGDILNEHPFDGQIPEWYGYNDGYIGRTDPTGNMRWIHSIGAYSADFTWALTETGGRITMLGEVTNFGGTSNIYYNGTATPITADGKYVMQVDTAGNQLWLQQPYLGGRSIESDGEGNIYYFVIENGMRQCRKVDLNGNMLEQFEVTDLVECNGLAISPTGDIWVAGSTGMSIPGSITWAGQTYVMPSGDYDIFLAKFNPTGVPQFATRFRSAGNDLLHGLVVAADGTVHMSGYFGGIVEQDGDTLSGDGDRWFLASFNSDGNLVALDDTSFRTKPSIGHTLGQLRVNDAGEVFAGLNFRDTLFQGMDTILQPPFSSGGVLAKWNTMGQLSWYRSFGTDALGRVNTTVTLGSVVQDSVFIGGRAQYGAYTALVIDTTYVPLTTSVPANDAIVNMNWKVFPNPAKNYLTLNNIGPGTRVQLIDPMGHILLERILSDGKEIIDLAGVPSGCYIVRLRSAAGTASKRVIVLQ